MKRILLFLSFITSISSLIAQPQGLDSLLEVMENPSAPIEEFKALYSLSRYYQDTDLNESYCYFLLCKSLAFEKEIKEYYGIVYEQEGNLLWRYRLMDSAAVAFEKAANHLMGSKQEEFLYQVYYFLGNYSNDIDSFDLALKYFEQNIELAQKWNNISQLMVGYYLLATYYSNLNKLEKALEEFHKALKLSADIEGKEYYEIGRIYQDLGITYSEVGDLELAEKYLRLSINPILKGKDPELIPITWNVIGEVFFEKNQLDSAEYYFKKAEVILAETQSATTYHIGLINNNLALTHVKKGEYKEALDYALNNEIYLNQLDQTVFLGKESRIRHFNILGNIYLKLKKFQESKSISSLLSKKQRILASLNTLWNLIKIFLNIIKQ